jgi:hypothetical protein
MGTKQKKIILSEKLYVIMPSGSEPNSIAG